MCEMSPAMSCFPQAAVPQHLRTPEKMPLKRDVA